MGLSLISGRMPCRPAKRDKYPDTAIVVITGYATVRTAVKAMKLGAVDFIPKPFTPDEIYNAAQNVAARLKKTDRRLKRSW